MDTKELLLQAVEANADRLFAIACDIFDHPECGREEYYACDLLTRFLEGEGFMELDGDKVPVKPGNTVYIPAGCRHRALGQIKIANVSVPSFDPEDEYFD